MYFTFTTRYKKRRSVLITDVDIFPPNDGVDPKSKSITVKAIWDTGASGSVVTQTAADSLGLTAVGKVRTRGVNGVKIVDQYLVNIGLPNRVMFGMINVSCSDQLPAGCEALIGMDIISQGNLSIDNNNGKTTMSFIIPPTDGIDYIPIGQELNFIEKTKGMPREQKRKLEREYRKHGKLPPKKL